MLAKIAKQIVEIGNDVGLDIRLCEGYSGRNMYGQTTTGVVGTQTDIIQAIAEVCYQIGLNRQAFDKKDFNFRWDDMGRRDSIAY